MRRRCWSIPTPGVPGTPAIDPANPANLLVAATDGVPLTLPAADYFTDPNGDTLTITPNPASIPAWLTWDRHQVGVMVSASPVFGSVK